MLIIRNRKGRAPLLVAVLVVLFVSLLTFDSDFQTDTVSDFRDILDTYDLGVSQIPADLSKLFSKAPEILWKKIRGFPGRPNIKRIDIDVGLIELNKIKHDREIAIKKTILRDPTQVKAFLRYGGKKYKAKIRLKGDLRDHWKDKYRWSFRIVLKGKNTILGFKKFSLHKPLARQHPYEQIFQSLVRKTDNLAAVHDYVKVYVNGEDWGIMNIEEHMSKQLLEKQRAKNSIIVKFSNENGWYEKRVYKRPYAPVRKSDPLLHLRVYSKKKSLENIQHRKWFSYIASERLKDDHSHLYDIDKYSQLLFLSMLWGNAHTLAHSNSRHYFNPYTLRMEPITTDQGNFLPIKNINSIFKKYDPVKKNEIYKQVISTQSFINNWKNNLEVAMSSMSGFNNTFERVQKYFPLDKKVKAKTIRKNISKVKNNKDEILKNITNKNEESSKSITVSKEIKPPSGKQAANIERHVHVRHYSDGKIGIYNMLPQAVNLLKVYSGNKIVYDSKTDIPGYVPGKYDPYLIATDEIGIKDNRIKVLTDFEGNIRTQYAMPTLLTEGLFNPLLRAMTDTNNVIKKRDSNVWVISEGEWLISNPVTVPGDLVIEPGAKLLFDDDAYIIIQGSLNAQGTEKKTIILEPKNDAWKGLYVFESSSGSVLRNVVIRNTNSLEDGLLKLTSGVTFYRSDVEMDNVVFDGTYAEDALNIVKSSFTLSNVKIHETASDGLDSDYSDGVITNSEFSRIGGDALDFSGSKVDINSVNVEKVHDKGVSAGEASEISIVDSVFRDIGVGVASKDGSKLSGVGLTIENYSLNAAMTYSKKSYYDAPEMRLMDLKIDGARKFARQTGTTMYVDDVEIAETKLDVRDLYQGEVMKK